MSVVLSSDSILRSFDLRGLTPDSCRERTLEEIRGREFVLAGESVAIGDVWKVTGDPSDGELVIRADCSRGDFIGAGMKSGSLTIDGDAGDHLGAGMLGGTIQLRGNARHWAGAELSGGLIRISGNAGESVGGAYPGSRFGMRDGTILVEGSCGPDAGMMMRRGLIAIGGDAGDAAGRNMIAGSIFAFGRLGARAGSGMKRGTIATFAGDREVAESLPVSFISSGRFRPHFLNIYLRFLEDLGFGISSEFFAGRIDRFNGDFIELGLGEVLVWSRT